MPRKCVNSNLVFIDVSVQLDNNFGEHSYLQPFDYLHTLEDGDTHLQNVGCPVRITVLYVIIDKDNVNVRKSRRLFQNFQQSILLTVES